MVLVLRGGGRRAVVAFKHHDKVLSMVQSQGNLLRIGAVAAQSGVSVDTIRYYERRGIIDNAVREPSGYRNYPAGTVQRVHLARRLQTLGLTLDEIVAALQAHDAGNATCASERWRLETVRDRVQSKLAELQALNDVVNETLDNCKRGHCTLSGFNDCPSEHS